MTGFDQVREGLEKTYGSAEGQRVYGVVMPGILADFTKMLKKAPAGAAVREVYHLEDGRGSIFLRGFRNDRGNIIEAEYAERP